ncbi:Pre-mRNA-splicing factor of RES complex-domain-containing protein [Colletotrichum phormii]|uniref:Pre-mRNA-splicing factor of RES complex-domain-containing protein n=1 Tax=Colletotrichum phormii TaxID=359342 RepID=A0AAJ0EDZ1_9PEZI|nr:Pre-mRNA-splicing factor of RES complex-domain-containing protein [Colletotrichum phormii]KAK1635484.1 Pre-mRNA-splicing factor of RES complex-domain-containing protein [Colletotrichum phormii]
MPSDLSSYLATRYLVADPKPTKKRKRKQATETQGLIIADDDDAGWGNSTAQDDDAESGPALVSGTSAEFRRTKKSNWKTVAAAAASSKPQGDNGDDDDSAAAANAILASAAAENAAAGTADDEMPIIEGEAPDVVKMSDGTHAGLQSAAAVSAQLRRRQQAEEAEFAKLRKHGKEEETVYRDATGRRVDVSMKRAEARKLALEAEEKERLAKLAPKGDVQLENARKRREALEDAKLMTFARTADDVEMNNELKEQERWNDPMAQFLSEKTGGGGAGAKGKKGKRRPVYAGAAPPNRYGIKPGYRWDGVDRSNGFEGDRFKAINRRERNKGLDYAWQMDE